MGGARWVSSSVRRLKTVVVQFFFSLFNIHSSKAPEGVPCSGPIRGVGVSTEGGEGVIQRWRPCFGGVGWPGVQTLGDGVWNLGGDVQALGAGGSSDRSGGGGRNLGRGDVLSMLGGDGVRLFGTSRSVRGRLAGFLDELMG